MAEQAPKREPTELEVQEAAQMQIIWGSEELTADGEPEIQPSSDPPAVGNALAQLGLIHVAMDANPEQYRQGTHEIWAGMHTGNGLQNLGILARFAWQTYVVGDGNPLVYRHQKALRKDAKKPRADEQ